MIGAVSIPLGLWVFGRGEVYAKRHGKLKRSGSTPPGSCLRAVRIEMRQSTRVSRDPDTNVVGGELLPCSLEPMTGFFRDGCCATGPEDIGSHTVCVEVTAEFLEFSKRAGNDLDAEARMGLRGSGAR